MTQAHTNIASVLSPTSVPALALGVDGQQPANNGRMMLFWLSSAFVFVS